MSLQVFQTRVGLITAFELQQKHKTPLQHHWIASILVTDVWPAHSALVRLLSCVSAHMNHQHVLGFKWPLFP